MITHLPGNNDDQFPGAHREDQVALFICLLNDIQHSKNMLMGYLPWMISKAKQPGVKKALLNFTTNIQTEQLKLQMCHNLASEETATACSTTPLHISFESHLRGQLSGMNNYMTDYLLLSHMLFIENVESVSFKQLLNLSRVLAYKELASLVKENLQQARADKKRLEELLALSLIN